MSFGAAVSAVGARLLVVCTLAALARAALARRHLSNWGDCTCRRLRLRLKLLSLVLCSTQALEHRRQLQRLAVIAVQPVRVLASHVRKDEH
ncbi:hypothetical protein PF005_g14370 [Phytophthora fragariae]|uniref:RxLR effector protein n=1 Tax=Phytophthora fragariae TaxID=53985 RepID=A0A6A3YJP7_9STRA|nr:hypothetical protein PF009_g15721 [Phytophthora fragariae]KAE9102683.1 hypothetical protein PF007_g14681 [Phytophthora fragariae]KAE9202992.1 hypothetical protein PF005_g14370 [Phytophthora fragariae]KAE9220225.1 hypothetical protein PF002_g15953 [Phytophthora fragariae]